ncbi:hypothetical protein [Staphylococcus haemolyticus]|uniref:Uncharacterized protein n=1 Tax=Staphylococcus haemolyticus (strain JCSC1435) TaxID=279808 RepID=Q4L4N6_STAHJ|nr:hypothetical protein [Staphylococcus haemolyticus]MCI2943548.1 hypothetical protein [Staphylococcus haemolyticus]MCI2946694.1 hypothetical protein [Staphylococcus haemolyticus]QUX18676.1 hypothetical protein RES7_004265 [Staphylococcus haemolyticus]UCI00659.1 hypothetical protein RES5_004335 [Staphylococcus haemolyticus]UCI02883.1 hypothetical protein RES6_004320 [Staphylococcus haemolyticus]
MYLYKIFKNMNKKKLELLKYKSNHDYLEFLEVERKKGNIELILNNQILIKLAFAFLEKQYEIANINVPINPYIDINDYKFSKIESFYNLYKLNNEVFKDSNHYIKIHEIKVISNKKYEEITIQNNGIIKIETDTLEESKDDLTRIVNEIFGINCYANIQ